jgi:hypothetical protein
VIDTNILRVRTGVFSARRARAALAANDPALSEFFTSTNGAS